MGKIFGGAGGIASAAGGIAGTGASIAGGAASAAGGVAGAAGGAGGIVSGIASGGALGIVGAIGGIVGAVSGVIGNFQARTTNDRLALITQHLATQTSSFADWYGALHEVAYRTEAFLATSIPPTITHRMGQDLSRIRESNTEHTALLRNIAAKVNQPPVVRIDGDAIGSAISSSLRLNRGGARETVETVREQGDPTP